MAIGKRVRYYYNTETGKVEEGPQSAMRDLLGPFDTAEEARNAWAIVEARSEAADEYDREGREDDDQQDD